jgi:aspartate carbamoyltransferase catalytic subunit
LAKLLAQLRPQSDRILRFFSPLLSLGIPDSTLEYCDCHGIKYEVMDDLEKVCVGAQVLYVTRIQKERFDNVEEYEQLKGS